MSYVKRDWDNTGNTVTKDDFKRIEYGIESVDSELDNQKNATIPGTLAKQIADNASAIESNTEQINVLSEKHSSVLLANGVFRTGDTITLTSKVSGFNKLILISGDGLGTPNPISADVIYPYNYPTNFTTGSDFVFGNTNYNGEWEITIKTGGESIEVTYLSGVYIRKVYGIKGGA